MLALLILVSLAAHVALILLIPSFSIFPTPSQYIEIDMVEVGQALSAEQGEESAEESEFLPSRIPEEAAPVIETGLGALEWDTFAPQPAGDLREFEWQALMKPEQAAPETIPPAEMLMTQENAEKERPDMAERELSEVSLVDDAVTAVEPPPRQTDEETIKTPDEFALSPPAEVAEAVMPEMLPPLNTSIESGRTLPVEPREVERATWAQLALEKEMIAPARLPEAKSVPEFEQHEAFQVDVPPVSEISSLSAEQFSPSEEMPFPEKIVLSALPISPSEPMLTARIEREMPQKLPTSLDREPQVEPVISPVNQPISSSEKAIPAEQTPEALPVSTVARGSQETPAATEIEEFLPPQPVAICPGIAEDDARIAIISEMPTLQPSRPAVLESRRLPSRFASIPAQTIPAMESVPEQTMTKALPPTLDEIAEVSHEDTAPEEETVQIEGPASARQVAYRPARLPSVTLDRDVTIRLKFWVLPDGTIGEVVPLQRGDVRLEQAAIQYVKSWRFTPISGSETVWGIIPVKYRLK